MVPGYGPRNAKIMFVGEAPASTEVKLGIPFQGRAGIEFDTLLKSASINREECYVTNISLEPVTGDKKKFFFNGRKPSPTLIAGMAQVFKDIQEIKPNVVVPMGNYALWGLTGINGVPPKGILKWRGSILPAQFTGTKVIPTIHPAAIIRGKPDDDEKGQGGLWKYRSVVIWDMERIEEQSRFPEISLRKREIIVDPVGLEREMAIERLVRAQRKTFDCETYGGTNLACIGFNDFDPGWAVVFTNTPENHSLFKMLLEDDVPKCGQNLMYDTTLLDMLGIHTKNVEWDTMHAQHVILTDLPKGLDFMTSIYTDMPYYKDEGKIWNQPKTAALLHQFKVYCGKDVCATTEIAMDQMQTIAASPDHTRTYGRMMAVFDPLRSVTIRGARVDMNELGRIVVEAATKRDKLQKELDIIAGRAINPRSVPQVKQLLYEDRQLPVRTLKGKPTTQARILNDLAVKTGDEALGLVVNARKASKVVSTYVDKKTGKIKVISSDGRIRWSYNISGTKGERLSSDAPLWGPGINGQNIPAKHRKFILADEGYEIGEFDQAQAEAVVVAYISNDPIDIDCFRTGKDVHRVTACLFTGKDPSEWKSISKDAPIRQLCKKSKHAFNYAMGADTFCITVNNEYDPEDPLSIKIDTQTARATREMYLKIHPSLYAYWDGVKQMLRDNKMTLRTPLGRVRTVLDPWSDTLLKDCYSWIPQATVGGVTNIGIARAMNDPELIERGVLLFGQTHDSAAFMWPVEHREFVVPRIFQHMEVELYISGYRVVIPIEGYVGPNWYKGDMTFVGKSRETCEIM